PVDRGVRRRADGRSRENRPDHGRAATRQASPAGDHHDHRPERRPPDGPSSDDPGGRDARAAAVHRATARRVDEGATVETMRSKDGTSVAYDRVGEGPPVIFLDGALSTR